jgi:hypothetical protein
METNATIAFLACFQDREHYLFSRSRALETYGPRRSSTDNVRRMFFPFQLSGIRRCELDSSVLSKLQETLFCELAEHPGLRNHFPYMGFK